MSTKGPTGTSRIRSPRPRSTAGSAKRSDPSRSRATIAASPGGHKLRATAAIFAANDTSGTLADLPRLGASRPHHACLQPLAAPADRRANGEICRPRSRTRSSISPRLCEPARLLCQARVAAAGTDPHRAIPLRQSRRPQEVNDELEWGWRTKFDNLGLAASLGDGAELKAQAMQGRTRMGYVEDGGRWVNNRFRSAFATADRSHSERSGLPFAQKRSTPAIRAASSMTNIMRPAGPR